MAVEVHPLVLAAYYAYVIGYIVKQAMGPDMAIDVATDSNNLFDVVVEDGTKKEKRLQIDIVSLREAYTKEEVRKITSIPGTTNPADVLPKNAIGYI